MPPIEEQLPPCCGRCDQARAVCRWTLHRRHGAYGYESAKAQYAPFDLFQDPDPETRATSPASSPEPAAWGRTLM